MIYVCTERPYPTVQVVSPVVNAVFSFGGGGQLDTMELAKVRHLPSEWIDEAVEALPEFQGKGKKREGRTVFRLEELEPAEPGEGDDEGQGEGGQGEGGQGESGEGDREAEDDAPGA